MTAVLTEAEKRILRAAHSHRVVYTAQRTEGSDVHGKTAHRLQTRGYLRAVWSFPTYVAMRLTEKGTAAIAEIEAADQ